MITTLLPGSDSNFNITDVFRLTEHVDWDHINMNNILSHTPEDFLRVNICGKHYDILRTMLDKHPTTLLGDERRRRFYYVDFMNAYYFNQDVRVFEAVLFYYQTSTLLRPPTIPMNVFLRCVRFYDLPIEVVTRMQVLEGYVPKSEKKEETDKRPDTSVMKKVWTIMEYPNSSFLARIIAALSVIVILVSMLNFCAETLPQFHHSASNTVATISATATRETALKKVNCTLNKIAKTDINSTGFQQRTGDSHSGIRQNNSKTFQDPLFQYFIDPHHIIECIEGACTAWFTVEYIVRFISSPMKWKFFSSFLNIVDLLAILPYFFILAITHQNGSPFGIIRVARLFRIFKLSRHFHGLKILGNTFKASLNELAIIVFMMCFSIILFSSGIYYAEYEGDDSNFASIPDTFWYTLVTMTTVGYGDYVPLTIIGKILGAACAINGVLVLAMVVPVIANNFMLIYERDK